MRRSGWYADSIVYVPRQKILIPITVIGLILAVVIGMVLAWLQRPH